MSDPNANRAGYKETKVGWIPMEWKCHVFGDIVELSEYGLSLKNSPDGNIPIAGMKHISDGRVVLVDCPSVEMNREDAERYYLRTNDLLFNRTNSLEHVGKLGIVRGDSDTVFASYLVRLRVNPSGSPAFIAAFFNLTDSRNKLKKLATPGVAQYNINATELKRQVFVPFPPLPEQDAIAEILSTCDGVIQKTGELIGAKNRQKKALMQQLLTGKKRLPGFDEKWSEVKIGDIFDEVSRPVEWNDEELYNLISVRRRSGGLFFRDALHGKDILTKTMNTTHTGDFLISKMQVVHGAMAMTTPEFDGGHVSGSYITLVSKKGAPIHMPFFDYLSRTKWLYHLTFISSYGVVIEKMTFNLKDLFKKTIKIPPTIEEQERISEILKTCEDEGISLSKKLNALKQQKKALMQKLLTGQVRVKV